MKSRIRSHLQDGMKCAYLAWFIESQALEAQKGQKASPAALVWTSHPRNPARRPCSSCLHLLLLFSTPRGSPFCSWPNSRGQEVLSDIQAKRVSWKIQVLVCSLFSAPTLVYNTPLFTTEFHFFFSPSLDLISQTGHKLLTPYHPSHSLFPCQHLSKCFKLNTLSGGLSIALRLKSRMCDLSYEESAFAHLTSLSFTLCHPGIP